MLRRILEKMESCSRNPSDVENQFRNCHLVCSPGEQSGPDLRISTCVKCPQGFVQNKTCCASDRKCKCEQNDGSVPNSQPEMIAQEGSKIIDKIASERNERLQEHPHDVGPIVGQTLVVLGAAAALIGIGLLAYKKERTLHYLGRPSLLK